MTFLYRIITASPWFMKCSFRHGRARVSLRGLSDKRVYFINLQPAVAEGKSIRIESQIKKLDNYAVTNINIHQIKPFDSVFFV
jgi:hypothetical protein